MRKVRNILMTMVAALTGVLLLMSLTTVSANAYRPTYTEPAVRTVEVKRITYTEGHQRHGFWIEWSDGSAAGWPAKRVALRECRRDADFKRTCIKRTHRTYKRLARIERRLNG